MPEFGAADQCHAADGKQQAEVLQGAWPFAEAGNADGGEEKDLQAVQQGGNAGADGVDAFVP